ncbi:MAG: exosortase N [Bacteroidota bacterium]
MIKSLPKSFWLWSLAWLLVSIPLLWEYPFNDPGASHLWVLLLPVVIYVPEKGKLGDRYGLWALTCLALHQFAPIAVLRFLALAFTAFFILERYIGRLNTLAPILLLLVNPATTYLLDVFGFPIRLKLTAWTGTLLRSAGYEIEVAGNMLARDGIWFSVDPACMGLNLIITAALATLVLITFAEKQQQKRMPLWATGLWLGLSLGLTIVANLFRIVALVVTGFPPGSAGHELVGLLLLIGLVIFPLYLLMQRWGHRLLRSRIQRPSWNLLKPWSHLLLATLILALGFFAFRSLRPKHFKAADLADQIALPGFAQTRIPPNIIRLQNSAATVFFKPIPRAINRDHHPHLCWTGGGYLFRQEHILEIAGQDVWVADLEGPDGHRFTAWWYDNGEHQTVDQWDWRWRMLRGEPGFMLINVSTRHEAELYREVGRLLQRPYWRPQ